jgi:hypothetical protein
VGRQFISSHYRGHLGSLSTSGRSEEALAADRIPEGVLAISPDQQYLRAIPEPRPGTHKARSVPLWRFVQCAPLKRS